MGAAADRLVSDAETFLDMISDDVVMEFPYTPPGGMRRLEGKAAVAAYLPIVSRLITIDSMSAKTLHHTIDPGIVILEFSCTWRGTETGLLYDQDYISVITFRDGRIIHYRDYWNPLIVLRATGGEAAIAAAMKETADAA